MPGVHMSEQIKKNGPDVGATSEKVHANRCRCRFCLKLFERMINLLPIYSKKIKNVLCTRGTVQFPQVPKPSAKHSQA